MNEPMSEPEALRHLAQAQMDLGQRDQALATIEKWASNWAFSNADAAGAGVRPLLFDEAFYGIDAGRRDELLRLATELDLQLVVASPDQDGVTPAVRVATTLFVIKDTAGDVHLAPYHFRNPGREPQAALFAPADG